MFHRSLTMSYHSQNYPSRALGYVSTHKNMYKPLLIPVQAVSPTSILLRPDGSDKFPRYKKTVGSGTALLSSSTSSLLSQSNMVGIIGGVSVDSTLNFLRRLVQCSSSDGEYYVPPFILCSAPILSRELLLLERDSPPSFFRSDECLQLDHTSVIEDLQNKRIFLEKSGARCIVMPCHILHSWHDEVFKECSVPFLHIGECVARELKEANLKPMEAGSYLRIGVLATDETFRAGYYQEKLQTEGFEVVLPDKATMEHTVIPATEALKRKDMDGAQNLLRIALQVLLVRAVSAVVLASDEMCGVLPEDDPLLKKCIDPMDALARSTIKWANAATETT